MGSLVLVFGGFLAFTIVQSSLTGDSATVSQITETESTKGGPNFQTEPTFPSDTSSVANTTANSAANSNSSLAATGNRSSNELSIEKGPNGGGGGGRNEGNSFILDGASSADVTAAPPPAAAGATQPAMPKDVRERDDLKTKTEDKVTGVSTQEAEKSSSNLSLMKKDNLPGAPAQSGPMRNSENQYNRQLENLNDRRAAAKRSAARDEESASGRRVVSGKTFDRKQGVWYDTTYQGRPTINIRRGTDEYNRLDAGLRSIANSLGGTVVIVWGAKAYRIQ